jgi:hypothetical protein
MPEIPVNLCTYYAFTDPASGKKSRSTALKQSKQAIVVCAVSQLTHIFCVHAWLGKLPTTAYVDKLLKIHADYPLKSFGIEANAMQSLFADQVYSQAKQTQLKRVVFTPFSQPTNIDKKFRIRTHLEPVINHGRLFIHPSLVELDAGLRGFPVADDYLDLIDCLASCIGLIPRRSAAITQNEEVQSLAKYLRDTGAPSWYIEARIQEVRAELSRKSTNDPQPDTRQEAS